MRIRISFFLRIQRAFLLALRSLRNQFVTNVLIFSNTHPKALNQQHLKHARFVENIKCSSGLVSANFWLSRIVITSLDGMFHRVSSHCRND